MLAFLAVAYAQPPLYNTGNVDFRMREMTTAVLREQVRLNASHGGRQLLWAEGEGAPVSLVPRVKNGPRLAKLPRLGLLGLYIGLSAAREQPVELDIVLRDEEGTLRAVSVWTELDGSVAAAVGEPISLPPKRTWPELHTAYGLKVPPTEEQARFAPQVLGAVDEALALLPAELVATLSDIDWVRRAKPEDGHGGPLTPAARYGSEGEIQVFDRAVSKASFFVGSVERPHLPVVFAVLHEVGHALTDAPRRRIRRAWDERRAAYEELVESNAPRKKLQEEQEALDRMYEEGHALPRDGELAIAMVEATGGPQGAPTAYGRSTVAEAFAESFALFYADPAALKRASPKAYDWFAAGHHLPTPD